MIANGRISEVGTYRELLDRKGAFADFLYSYLETKDDQEEDDDEGTAIVAAAAAVFSLLLQFNSDLPIQ